MNEFGWDRWLMAVGFAGFYLWPVLQDWVQGRRDRTPATPVVTERATRARFSRAWKYRQ